MTSVLATDGYKMSMAEAGWPLRKETFYYSHRKGGIQRVPFDARAAIASMLPRPSADDWAFLASHEYEMGIGARHAFTLADKLEIACVPKGSWVLPREPILSITGPSALVSWLEPLVLQLSYRIQIATAEKAPDDVTCDEQREIVRELTGSSVPVDRDGYRARVRARASKLAEIAGADRVFEVGLRAASCMEQHLVALEGCLDAGIKRTSNVYGAQKLGMIPVGTMGHEHVMRYGDDEFAFRAMRERRPGRSSYLLDTFDTIGSGIPAAFEIIAEDPSARDSIRYDSGDKEAQYRHAVALAKERGIAPVHILEDGFDLEQTEYFEKLRNSLGVPPTHQFYGYGGFLVSDGPYTRDRVSAVYKLTQTGKKPVMKFGNESGQGKRSVPGHPVIFRKRSGDGPDGIIGQRGERVPDGYVLLTNGERDPGRPAGERVELSEATRELVRACEVGSK